ncbi:MAG: AMP-binding protein [Actinomycetales bacterium]|nr:AMP-binding protein [Actinomycetales bacterium]
MIVVDLKVGGLATAVALAHVRDAEAVALIRGEETWSAGRLHAAVHARAEELRADATTEAHMVRVDGGIGTIVELAAAAEAGRDALPLGPRLSDADAEMLVRAAAEDHGDGSLLVPSTGTSGPPHTRARGRLELRALLQLADVERRLGLPRDRPLLVLAPLDHGHGLSAVAAGLLRGLPVVLASRLDPSQQAALVARHRPGAVTGVPAQLAALDAAGGDWTGVEVVVSGSSPLPPGLRARITAAGPRVVDAYGTTETGTLTVDGRPVAGVRLRVDADGAIAARSPLGGRRELTLPDAARVERGRLTAPHRVDGRIDSGGETADPARLRAALEALPGVLAARVRVVEHTTLGAALAAEVEVDSSGPRDLASLRAALRGRVASAELPRSAVVRRAGDPPVVEEGGLDDATVAADASAAGLSRPAAPRTTRA